MELSDVCGVIENCIDSEWLLRFADLFKSLAYYEEQVDRNEYSYNTITGSIKHSTVTDILKEYLNNIVNIHDPIIYTLKGRSKVVGIHSDAPLTDPYGKPYYTFLIPLNGYEIFSTFVFNEHSDSIIGTTSSEEIVHSNRFPLIDNNVGDHCELLHLDNEVRKRISLN